MKSPPKLATSCPNRLIHDFAGALLRFDNGARGSFWVTQAAAGVENCLRIRVSGSKGSWNGCRNSLRHDLQASAWTFAKQNSKRTGHPAPSARSTRIVAGHPEGFQEGFANIYSDAAEAISARRAGKEADPLALYFPNSWDGLLGVRFVNSVIESSNANGKWTKC